LRILVLDFHGDILDGLSDDLKITHNSIIRAIILYQFGKGHTGNIAENFATCGFHILQI